MYRKKYSMYGVWDYLQFQAPTGGLGMYCPWIGRVSVYLNKGGKKKPLAN